MSGFNDLSCEISTVVLKLSPSQGRALRNGAAVAFKPLRSAVLQKARGFKGICEDMCHCVMDLC